MEARDRDLLKELAAAVSMQAQIANRTWLALMTVAVLGLLPRGDTSRGSISLPFGFGSIEAVWFYPVIFGLLLALIVAFSAAHAQQVRAQTLAQQQIEKLEKLEKQLRQEGEIRPRDLFDIIRLPSVIRVAPLAQVLRGRYQFDVASVKCPNWLWWSSTAYYVILKTASLCVYFLLPSWALWAVFERLRPGMLWWIFAGAGIIAGFTIVEVFILDLLYAVRVLRHLAARSSPLTKE